MKNLSSKLLIIFISVSCLIACKTQKTIQGSNARYSGSIASNAMVSTTHPLASQIGLEVLKEGGNAIDAAIAIQFALAVVYPSAGNIGGGGFMVYRSKEGDSFCLDFREKAPLKAHKDIYLDEDGNADKEKSRFGAMSVGVPGTIKGIFESYEKFGSMPIERLIDPAIEIAEKGFVISPKEITKFNDHQELFKNINKNNNYFRKENGYKEGDILIQKDLAKTLNRIKKNGVKEFYEGKTADLIVDQMRTEGGLISYEDLVKYNVIWRKPIEGNYKNYKIISMPPPSSGGILLIQMLKMLSHFDLSKYEHNSASYVHLISEVERRAFADRAEYLGDPDFYDIPIDALLSDERIKRNVGSINLKMASDESLQDNLPIDLYESMETTHFSVIDQKGNAVSVTTTLNGHYGSKLAVNGAGFFLNNEMDDFSAKPGAPNMFGLVGGEANAIAPEKRMLSSMTPTIVEKDGNLFMVLGSPGGSTIITSVFQTFLNVVDFDHSMAEAANNYRFHHQYLPNQIYYENDQNEKNVIADLIKMGHQTKARSVIGKIDAILVKPDGSLEGASDIRGEGAALGF